MGPRKYARREAQSTESLCALRAYSPTLLDQTLGQGQFRGHATCAVIQGPVLRKVHPTQGTIFSIL